MTTDDTVLVFGGTRGLGLSIADSLAANGRRVICASRSAPIGDIGHEYRAVDTTDSGSVESLFAELFSISCDAPSAIVYGSGISMDGLLVRQSRDNWRETFETNLFGAAEVIRQCGIYMPKHMKPNQSIVLLSSCVASRPAVGSAPYSASKAALESLSRSAAMEFSRYGIRVNCVAPGYIDEGMGKAVYENPKIWAKYEKKILAGRLGTGSEVSAAVSYLLAATYTNGAVLETNGGML